MKELGLYDFMKPTAIFAAGSFEVWASEKIALRKSVGKE
jgi:hypothetical protein